MKKDPEVEQVSCFGGNPDNLPMTLEEIRARKSDQVKAKDDSKDVKK